MKRTLKNWGNYLKVSGNVRSFETTDKLIDIFTKAKPWISRGMGRCYGDSSLGENVISTLKYNRIQSFDMEKGIIECQSGITLDELLHVIVPNGWFLPVSPGTKYVSVGGAVASDIHGKNHHKEGSFCRHTLELQVLCSDGKIYSCSRDQHDDLFRATCGGMGLSGIILSVKFRLKKISTSYIKQKQIKAANLDELIDLFEEHKDYTYSMAWVDCQTRGSKLGRGILMLGEHVAYDELPKQEAKNPLKTHAEAKLNIPFNFPKFVLNEFSIRMFNILYYHKNFKRVQNNIVHYDSFFYPLDHIRNWNRMYGKRGFLQYQFVLPLDQISVLKIIMERISEKKYGSFLTVLKVFGPQDGLISFPLEGYTLALDFPVKEGIMELLDELDQLVLESGGRIYLAKDARMKKDFFRQSYPGLDEFSAIVHKYNPESKFKSAQSERLSIIK